MSKIMIVTSFSSKEIHYLITSMYPSWQAYALKTSQNKIKMVSEFWESFISKQKMEKINQEYDW